MRASLARSPNGRTEPALEAVFGWMEAEIRARDPHHDLPLPCLMDGQGSLWEAAYLFYPEQSQSALDFVVISSGTITQSSLLERGIFQGTVQTRMTAMRSITLAVGDATRSRDRRRKPLLSGILLALLGTAAVPHAAGSGQQVEQLIAKAGQAMAANRLTTPATDNAVAYIERVLALSPHDSRAMALLEQVVARYQRLVGEALDQGERARLQSLDRAITFRDRAHQVINKHGLSSDAVAGMDESIAALGKPATGPAPAGTTDERLKELLDQHAALASAFLAEQNLQEADWHVAQADALAARYRLQAQEGLVELRHQVSVAE
ncbi:MAG: hypothetical protein WA970_19195, partial [Gammaproteobacteria bacterium]